MWTLLQISWRVSQWKNYENRSTSDEVIVKVKRVTFLRQSIYRLRQIFESKSWREVLLDARYARIVRSEHARSTAPQALKQRTTCNCLLRTQNRMTWPCRCTLSRRRYEVSSLPQTVHFTEISRICPKISRSSSRKVIFAKKIQSFCVIELLFKMCVNIVTLSRKRCRGILHRPIVTQYHV